MLRSSTVASAKPKAVKSKKTGKTRRAVAKKSGKKSVKKVKKKVAPKIAHKKSVKKASKAAAKKALKLARNLAAKAVLQAAKAAAKIQGQQKTASSTSDSLSAGGGSGDRSFAAVTPVKRGRGRPRKDGMPPGSVPAASGPAKKNATKEAPLPQANGAQPPSAVGSLAAGGRGGQVVHGGTVGPAGIDKSPAADLVKRHMPLVSSLARSMMNHVPQHVDRNDLISEGYIGLIEAARRYDPSRGNKFETFARSRIAGAMIDWLRSLDILPRSARDKLKNIEAVGQDLAKTLGRPPAEVEVAAKLGVTLAEHQQNLSNLSCRFISINGAPTGNGNEKFTFELRDESSNDPVEVIDAADFWKALKASLETLPEREKFILSMMCLEGLNLKEIGFILDYSPSTVRQIRERAMNHLQVKIQELRSPGQVVTAAE